MIKFFRKIRQKMLNENKFSKYLLYAIGEIILVVIGILIALQINNWNEYRKEKHSLKVLTENLHNEFKTNLESLEIDFNRLKRKNSAIDKLLTLTGSENIEIAESIMDSLLFEASTTPTWNPSSFTLNEIKNSGKLSDIKNTELKSLLYKWERLFEDIIEWQNALTSSIEGPLDIIKRKGSIVNMDYYNRDNNFKSKFDVSNLNLLQEILFENELKNNLYSANELEIRYSKAKILLKAIIEQAKIDIVD